MKDIVLLSVAKQQTNEVSQEKGFRQVPNHTDRSRREMRINSLPTYGIYIAPHQNS